MRGIPGVLGSDYACVCCSWRLLAIMMRSLFPGSATRSSMVIGRFMTIWISIRASETSHLASILWTSNPPLSYYTLAAWMFFLHTIGLLDTSGWEVARYSAWSLAYIPRTLFLTKLIYLGGRSWHLGDLARPACERSAQKFRYDLVALAGDTIRRLSDGTNRYPGNILGCLCLGAGEALDRRISTASVGHSCLCLPWCRGSL